MKSYENINQNDRDSLEAVISKMVADAYQKGLNHGMFKREDRIVDELSREIEALIELGGSHEEYIAGVKHAYLLITGDTDDRTNI